MNSFLAALNSFGAQRLIMLTLQDADSSFFYAVMSPVPTVFKQPFTGIKPNIPTKTQLKQHLTLALDQNTLHVGSSF
jgi:hypothetical protein